MNQADTAWMLISTALVLLMTPALAFFYGGLVRSKNALNTMMMSFISLGFVGVAWARRRLLAGVRARQRLVIGDLSRLFLQRRRSRAATARFRTSCYMCYQGTFCIITAALISGAIVERMRFSAYVTFITLWALVVYCPIAHWVWGGGWLVEDGRARLRRRHRRARQRRRRGARRRASWSASGATTRRRRCCRTTCRSRCSAPGCCGSAGSASTPAAPLAANGIAALAFTATMLAPAGTLVVWTLLDVVRTGKPTAVGCATAIVVGLVAITPAAGFVGPMSAIALGAHRGVPELLRADLCARKTSLDDSLDVVAAHGVGGTVGALLTGVFAQKALNGVADGVLFGNPAQLGDPGASPSLASDRLQRRDELRPAEADRRWSCPLRADADDESIGLDITQHGEEAYVHADGSSGHDHDERRGDRWRASWAGRAPAGGSLGVFEGGLDPLFDRAAHVDGTARRHRHREGDAGLVADDNVPGVGGGRDGLEGKR